jgi:CMP-N,N'-diacetyllegionaminic acid synthase
MRNLAVIPARSGSKGIKDKNIKMLSGKPLLAYTIEAAKQSGLFDEIFVSTDSEKYAKIAQEWGASVPFLREDELSTDIASSWDVVKNAIIRFRDMGKEFDTVALLQPTSPLRTADDIIAGYNMMKEKDANIIVAVCEVDHSPLWSNILPKDLSFINFINQDIVNMPRQSLPIYYRINGALYIAKTKYLMSTDNIYADKSYAVIMSKEHSVDIDDEMDFVIAEVLLKKI